MTKSDALADAIIALCKRQNADVATVITACAIVQGTFIAAALPNTAAAVDIAKHALDEAVNEARGRFGHD